MSLVRHSLSQLPRTGINGEVRIVMHSPPLIEQLPSDGLNPLWLRENIPAGGNGG